MLMDIIVHNQQKGKSGKRKKHSKQTGGTLSVKRKCVRSFCAARN